MCVVEGLKFILGVVLLCSDDVFLIWVVLIGVCFLDGLCGELLVLCCRDGCLILFSFLINFFVLISLSFVV